MLGSGQTLPAADRSLRVDKHSTGGIGDKTSFIVAPLLACCGLQVPMISGRGLGPTGGTLDKLESIPGVRTDLAAERNSTGTSTGWAASLPAPRHDLVPADRKLYALRDVTATVPSMPLITASIMSKKLAEGLSALVLDVKLGSGAFMKTLPAARDLAECLVYVGTRLHVPTHALLTSMDQPNGRFVGNSVEIDESLEILAGNGPADLRELVLELAGEILLMKHLAASPEAAKQTLEGHLKSGRAHERFVAMVAAQAGRLDERRPRATSWTLTTDRAGYVHSINAESLGLALVEMGGGRKQMGQPIDHSVGLEMLVRLGDRVERGQEIIRIFAPSDARARGLSLIASSLRVADQAPTLLPLVLDRVRAADVSESPAPIDTGRAVEPGNKSRVEPVQPPRTGVRRGTITPHERRELIEAAQQVRDAAYAPYSGFLVGAAVLCESGRVFVGANVENASFGLTICAERVALAAAAAAGERRFRGLAIVSPGAAAPCGACRQFAAEFSPDLPVLLVDSERPAEPVETNLRELLPGRFELPPASDQRAGHTGDPKASQHTAEPGP